jgi:AcrR family transcriptional regulator
VGGVTRPGPQGRYGGRSAEERRADRRARLIEAGLDTFGTNGYALSTVGRIAKAANLSTRQYYEEFSSREALLLAVYDSIQAQAEQAVAVALGESAGKPLGQQIEAAIRAHLGSTATDLRRAKVAFVEIIGVSPGVETHRMRTRARWTTLINAMLDTAVAAGELPARDRRLAPVAFIGAVNGLAQDWCATEDRPPLEDVIDQLCRLAGALSE